VNRDPRLISDIDVEPAPMSDEGRVLALLESRVGERVPVYELAGCGGLQYGARCHALRHEYGYVILNGEHGRTPEGRKKTWFSLLGRLTRSQLAALEDLCRRERIRYNAAIKQVFPGAAAYLSPSNVEKRKLIRNYPSRQMETSPAQASLPLIVPAQLYRDPEEQRVRR